MKVYIVYAPYADPYDGEIDVNFKVFASKEEAEAYRESRKTRDGYYWDKLIEKEIN